MDDTVEGTAQDTGRSHKERRVGLSIKAETVSNSNHAQRDASTRQVSASRPTASANAPIAIFMDDAAPANNSTEYSNSVAVWKDFGSEKDRKKENTGNYG